jgi:anti-sigma regulatory factor (Ser/Thr protein kinase)
MSPARLVLPPVTQSVGEARRFLHDNLQRWGLPDLEWGAVQVLSELATNAVMHARTEFTVVLRDVEELLRIEVHDRDPRLPHQRHYGVTATTGRGLALVATLSQSWGVDGNPAGKVVWCLVPRGGEAAMELDLDAFLTEEDRREMGGNAWPS